MYYVMKQESRLKVKVINDSSRICICLKCLYSAQKASDISSLKAYIQQKTLRGTILLCLSWHPGCCSIVCVKSRHSKSHWLFSFWLTVKLSLVLHHCPMMLYVFQWRGLCSCSDAVIVSLSHVETVTCRSYCQWSEYECWYTVQARSLDIPLYTVFVVSVLVNIWTSTNLIP